MRKTTSSYMIDWSSDGCWQHFVDFLHEKVTKKGVLTDNKQSRAPTEIYSFQQALVLSVQRLDAWCTAEALVSENYLDVQTHQDSKGI